MKRFAHYVVPVLRPILAVFFDREFLTGRFFERSFGGYLWAVRAVWTRNILRLAKPMPWPVGLTCHISNPRNIVFHPDDLNNFQSPGTYFQNFSGVIHLGRGCYIAPNVGLITANHLSHDLESHGDGRDIVIGERCWIGMNAVVLPGVVLGPGTVVAAGAVVNSSFPEGGVVVGGVPARILKTLGLAAND